MSICSVDAHGPCASLAHPRHNQETCRLGPELGLGVAGKALIPLNQTHNKDYSNNLPVDKNELPCPYLVLGSIQFMVQTK